MDRQRARGLPEAVARQWLRDLALTLNPESLRMQCLFPPWTNPVAPSGKDGLPPAADPLRRFTPKTAISGAVAKLFPRRECAGGTDFPSPVTRGRSVMDN
jgi:hypothetical protein